MKNIQDKKRIVLQAPTSSGKTLLAEYKLMTLLDIFNPKTSRFSIFISPMRSLLLEHVKNLRDLFKTFNVKIITEFEDIYQTGKVIFLTTPEQFIRELRSYNDRLNQIDLLILDEIHMVGDIYRGYLYELISSFLLMRSNATIIMSATMGNVDLLANWINSDIIIIEESRKIKLDKEIIELESNSQKQKKIIELVQTFAGQILIFRSQINFTEKLAEYISKKISLSSEKKIGLETMLEFEEIIEWNTKADKRWIASFKKGFPYHHSRIRKKQRELTEKAFSSGLAKCIISTPTLMMGINLPADMVIIAEPMIGQNKLTSIQLHQMAGRAGRPGLSKYEIGYVKFLSTSTKITDTYGYLLSQPRKLQSFLDSEKILTPLLKFIHFSFLTNKADFTSLSSHTIIKIPLKKKRNKMASASEDIFADLLKEKKLAKHPIMIALKSLQDYKAIQTKANESFKLTELGMICIKHNLQPSILYSLINSNIWSFEIGSIHFFDIFTKALKIFVKPTGRQLLTIDSAKKVIIKFNLSYRPEEWNMTTVGGIILWLLTQGIEHEDIIDLLDVYPISEEEAVEKACNWLEAINFNSKIFKIQDNMIKRINLLQFQLKYGLKAGEAEFSQIDGVGTIIARVLAEKYANLYEMVKDQKENLGKVYINDKPLGIKRAQKFQHLAQEILNKESG